MGNKGIDVSNNQGALSWPQIKTAGYQFALIKATEGVTFKDPDFKDNWDGAWEQGMLRGAYHFAHPGTDVNQAVIEFLGYVLFHGFGQRRPDTLWLDLEVSDGLPAPAVAAWARAFVNSVDWITGASCGVYTYPAFAAAGNCEGLGARPLWIAGPGDPAAPVPAPWRQWTLWQQGTADGGRLGDLDTADTGDLAGLWAALGGGKLVRAPG